MRRSLICRIVLGASACLRLEAGGWRDATRDVVTIRLCVPLTGTIGAVISLWASHRIGLAEESTWA